MVVICATFWCLGLDKFSFGDTEKTKLPCAGPIGSALDGNRMDLQKSFIMLLLFWALTVLKSIKFKFEFKFKFLYVQSFVFDVPGRAKSRPLK